MSTSNADDQLPELTVATQYWSSLLKAKNFPVADVQKFEKTLSTLLYQVKINNHWHAENPSKGQAHRSLQLDRYARPEPVLVKAGHSIGIHNVFDVLPSSVESVCMWVDPGEVAIKICSSNEKKPKEEVLYRQPQARTSKLSPLKASLKDTPLHYSDEFWQEKTGMRRSPSPTSQSASSFKPYLTSQQQQTQYYPPSSFNYHPSYQQQQQQGYQATLQVNGRSNNSRNINNNYAQAFNFESQAYGSVQNGNNHWGAPQNLNNNNAASGSFDIPWGETRETALQA